MAILSLIAAQVLMKTTGRYATDGQTDSWRESLVAAQSGIDRANLALHTSITDPVGAWAGWTTTDAAGQPLANDMKRLEVTLPKHAGEGNTAMRSIIEVDSPPSLAAAGGKGWRIRSTGVTEVATRRVSADSLDQDLRRFSLVKEKFAGQTGTGNLVTKPLASRCLEVIVLPESICSYSLIAEIIFKMNKEVIIDGYNSDVGLYDPATRTMGGTILANRWKNKAKPSDKETFDLGKATVYGDVLVDGTKKNVKGIDNVQGDLVTEQAVDLPNIMPPSPFFSADLALKKIDGKLTKAQEAVYKIEEKNAKAGGPATQMAAKDATAAAVLAAKGMELVASASALSPKQYKIEEIKLDKKNESLVLSNPPGATESWIEIWVTDKMEIKKGGSI